MAELNITAIATYFLAMWQVRTLATMYLGGTYTVVCFKRLELNSLLSNNKNSLCVHTYNILSIFI